ncbi:hypothetical protein NQ318_000836 [Aromia moschata]|uniref:superoxide dismutase n=1 Tax=Aromia moschata TaxID=1265417 RepID=A0AAV8XB13_9CUCU|nr:hypothetical protein NQ318_000836 [Aromia moschata]
MGPSGVIDVLFLNAILAVFLQEVCGGALQSIGIKHSLYEILGLGNYPIIIKAFPAIENERSNLFEIYVGPNAYGAKPQLAIAVIEGEQENGVKGELIFMQKHPPAGPTLIQGNVTGLTPGKHGIHIHQSGDLREGCEKLGGHFNPYYLEHGGPTDPVRHVGDLGNIEAGEDGTANVFLLDPLISLSGGHRNIVGRAIVVTSEADNLGRGDTSMSLISGDSGSPVGCGVIAYIR